MNENHFVIFIYYECRYAQFALSSVIELPRIPAYYPNLFRTIAILINNAFKTVQQSAKDKEDICKRADRTAKISDARFHTLMGRIKMHYFRGLL